METCLICGRDTDPDLLECGICYMCRKKKIRNNYDYVADKQEREIIKQLIKIEDLLS